MEIYKTVISVFIVVGMGLSPCFFVISGADLLFKFSLFTLWILICNAIEDPTHLDF